MGIQAKCDKLRDDIECLEKIYSNGDEIEARTSMLGFLEFTEWYVKQAEPVQANVVSIMEKESSEHLMGALCNSAFTILHQSSGNEWSYEVFKIFGLLDTQGEFVAMLKHLATRTGTDKKLKSSILEALLKDGYGELKGGYAMEWDVVYHEEPDRKLHCDFYYPHNRSSDELLPVVLYFHGGAWRYGNKLSAVKRLRHYHETGVVFVSVEYRLVDEAVWPCGYEDCVKALDFIKENAEKFGVDSSRIGVWGSSSGSHYLQLDQHIPRLSEEMYTGSPLAHLFGGTKEQGLSVVREACVSELITSDFPKTYTVHNNGDDVVPC